MSKRRISIPALLLLIIGTCMQLWAFLALQTSDALLQYCIAAPRAEKGALINLEPLQEKVQQELGTVIDAVSVHAVKTGVNLSFGDKNATATINAVSARMNETCPVTMETGCLPDGNELSKGECVIVLDSDLAFALFGSEEAENRELLLEGKPYRVIGTVPHSRGVGEVDSYSASIPLRAADAQALQMDIVSLNVTASASNGLRESFEKLARQSWGRGTLHDLKRERMSALLLTRVLLFALGMTLIVRAFRPWTRLLHRFSEKSAELRSRYYLKDWLKPVLLRALVLIASLALLLAAAYALLAFINEPLYSFTEWVPESFVDPKAIAAVFWNRSADAAQPLRIISAQSARIAFWATPARLGAICSLLGLTLVFAQRKKEKTWNKSDEKPV